MPTSTANTADIFTQRLCIWSGPLSIFLSLVGMVIVAGFVPATDPSASGQQIANFYIDNLFRIRLGMVIGMCGFTLFFTFGVAIALQTRRMERQPVMTYVQIAAAAVSAIEGVISAVIWLTASYRPDAIDPELTRFIHDLGWLFLLIDVPAFMIWIAAIGIAILRDINTVPIMPRWIGYFCLWVALLLSPALLIVFFKTGPFAYNGILALYLPFFTYFIWMVIMTPALLRAVKRP